MEKGVFFLKYWISAAEFDSALTNTYSILTGITGLFVRPDRAAIFYYAVKSTSFSF